ncbi:Serine/arginine-rich splicing factor 3 [Takifugu flavidus]|uniref:Serine/arginine-rich splicing factor 3 n=1 Tax=Takifugu flavidus TaxID=433684 RepID=A0A5C6N4A9_9TELE|nr:Serine/arginine-rich splicing factor 3 [Takifugu flavidus]
MDASTDSAMHRDCPLDCKVYVGNLGSNGNKTDLERAFGYYGPLRSVWVARNPPGFAFVEFEDSRDATDADVVWMPCESRAFQRREEKPCPRRSTIVEQAPPRAR